MRSLRTYLIIVILMASISLFDAVFSYLYELPTLYASIINVVFVLFFFYNITRIFVFLMQRLDHITLVLPFYHLIMFILFSTLGVYFFNQGLITGEPILAMVIISVLSSLFEMGFAYYLLKRFFKRHQ